MRVPTSAGLFLISRVHVVTGDGRELSEADVVISGGRILRVSDQRQSVAGAVVIDGRGKTLIPGLIDAHAHLDFLSVHNAVRGWVQERFVLPRALAELVRHGVTSIRCMADPLASVLRLRRRIEAGRLLGPRLRIAGPALTARGGHPEVTLAKDNAWLRTHIARYPNSPERAREVVRVLHTAGVDHVKFIYQGGPYGPDRIELRKLPIDVARAIIAEAHRLGLRVAAHTHFSEDVDTLLAAGVDSIEHGVIEHDLTGEAMLAAWAAAGTRLVPTLSIVALFPSPDGTITVDAASRNLARAHSAGVRIVAGTDSMVGAMPANTLHEELRRMVEAGLSEAEVLRAATHDAAELLGLDDRGVVADGKAADLVLLGSNPLERIENIADIEVVFRDGALVYQAPEPARPPTLSEYHPGEPAVLEYIDRTESVLPGEVLVRYDRSRFPAEGIRTLSYREASSGQALRTEVVTSGADLVTREWTCEIPGEGTSLHASADGAQITLTGTLAGEAVSRSYPLHGQTWMQLVAFDPATFITATDQSLAFVSIGASGRGALQLTDFELTKKTGGGTSEGLTAELVMPRWRRFWGAIVEYRPESGDLRWQQIRGKKDQVLELR